MPLSDEDRLAKECFVDCHNYVKRVLESPHRIAAIREAVRNEGGHGKNHDLRMDYAFDFHFLGRRRLLQRRFRDDIPLYPYRWYLQFKMYFVEQRASKEVYLKLGISEAQFWATAKEIRIVVGKVLLKSPLFPPREYGKPIAERTVQDAAD